MVGPMCAVGGGPVELAEMCVAYRKLYLPAVCDALYELGLEERILPSWIRPLLPDRVMVGEAYTVAGREILPPIDWDSGVLRIRSYLAVFERLSPDSVLVSHTDGTLVGHFGELTANSAKSRGCVGAVIDGNLRDVQGIREIDFPVFYRDFSPRNGIGRWEMVGEQVPVRIGAVELNPGDIVFGEFEAVLVIPRGQAEQVLQRSQEIVAAEGKVRKEVQQGVRPSESFDRHGHI